MHVFKSPYMLFPGRCLKQRSLLLKISGIISTYMNDQIYDGKNFHEIQDRNAHQSRGNLVAEHSQPKVNRKENIYF